MAYAFLTPLRIFFPCILEPPTFSPPSYMTDSARPFPRSLILIFAPAPPFDQCSLFRDLLTPLFLVFRPASLLLGDPHPSAFFFPDPQLFSSSWVNKLIFPPITPPRFHILFEACSVSFVDLVFQLFVRTPLLPSPGFPNPPSLIEVYLPPFLSPQTQSSTWPPELNLILSKNSPLPPLLSPFCSLSFFPSDSPSFGHVFRSAYSTLAFCPPHCYM